MPQACRYHKLPQRLAGQMNIVPLGKILAGQGWSEIMIMLAHDRDDALAGIVIITPVAWSAALTRDQAFGTGRM